MGLREFVTDEEGQIIVDDILKFENLPALPAYLRNHGIEIPDSIPRRNFIVSSSDIAQLSEESIQTINSLYRFEFNTFGYELIT